MAYKFRQNLAKQQQMKKLVKLAIICIAIAVLVLAIDYVIFHYVTIPDGKAGRSRQTVGHTTCLAVCRAVFVAWHGKPSCGVCAPAKERQLAHKNHQKRHPVVAKTTKTKREPWAKHLLSVLSFFAKICSYFQLYLAKCPLCF